MAGARSRLPIVPKAANQPSAFRAGFIQRAEIERIIPRQKSVAFRTLALGATLYHSTGIRQELVDDLISGNGKFHSPAFFMDVPVNAYGPTLITCKMAISVRVLDFCNFDTVTALYHQFETQEMFDACEALQQKAHANFRGEDLISMNSGMFKTERKWDNTLIAGLRTLGYAGWIMPFKDYKEIMLLDGANVKAESKIKQ